MLVMVPKARAARPWPAGRWLVAASHVWVHHPISLRRTRKAGSVVSVPRRFCDQASGSFPLCSKSSEMTGQRSSETLDRPLGSMSWTALAITSVPPVH